VVYSNNHEGWKIGYVRSTDRGDTWSDQQVLSDTVNTTQTRYPSIIRDNNALIVLWRAYLHDGVYHYNIAWSLSEDDGGSWSDPDYVLGQNWQWSFYLTASGADSTINVMASWGYAYTMYFYNVRSTDFGQSWSEPTELYRAAQGGRQDQLTMGSVVHYTWSGRYTFDEKIEIYYMQSTDNGINWSPSLPLSDPDRHHSQLPAIAADDSGNVAVTWMDFKYAPPGATGDIFIRLSADSGMSWSPEQQLTFNHFAFGSDIVVQSDTIYIAWEDESQGLLHRKIYYIGSADNGMSWSEPYWVDGTDIDSWNPALATSNGRVYVIWAEGSEDSGFGLYFSRYDEETRIVDDRPVLADMVRLRVYPNPFNSNVAIYLDMQKGGESGITIYDVNGRLVKTIFKGGTLEKGTHKFTWDATDAVGKEVSSGSYFAVASTPQGKISRRLTLIR
jgi:hypothetical protein